MGRQFERLIYALIVLSLVLFALETIPGAERYATFFDWSEYGIVVIFTGEYLLRIRADGKGYVRSFLGVVDLLAILPFYLSFGFVDLRVMRVCRLVRLLRIAKLHRYCDAWNRLGAAFAQIKHELAVFFGITVTLIYVASVGIYYCERDAQPEVFASVFHSMWWAICTLTTVGYGDVFPVTLAGRVFTFLILVLGLGIVSVPSGLLASALVNAKKRQNAEGRTDS